MSQIIPNLWFNKNAEEAVDFYLSVFQDSKKLKVNFYPAEGLEDFQKDFAGKVLTIEFEIMGSKLIAINAGDEFKFTEAVSLLVECEYQPEIDYYWEKLTSGGGEESVRGWLKDKYGLSWQVAPKDFDEKMKDPNAFQNFMKMKKIIIADL